MSKNENSIKNCLQIEYGDARQVAKITGFSYQYVRMVFCGIRHNQVIIDTIKEIVKNREKLKSDRISSSKRD